VQAPGTEETPGGTSAENSQAEPAAGQLPGTAMGPAGAETTAATAPSTAVAGYSAYAPGYDVPQANAGWTPSYSAGAEATRVRSSATLDTQPEPKSALVWLGSGLVGVAGAAGLVFFRLRNP
jgi:hypothetical protein